MTKIVLILFDSIAFISAIIACLYAILIYRLIRNYAFLLIILAFIYGIIVRLACLISDFTNIISSRPMLGASMACYWIILTSAIFICYKQTKHILKPRGEDNVPGKE